MATAEHYRGTQFARTLSVEADDAGDLIDLATTPVTVVLDDSAGREDVYRWRPAGSSDAEFSYDADAGLTLTLSSTATAAVAAGSATFSWFYDPPASSQKPIGSEEVVFKDPPAGVIPVVDP